MIERAHRLGRFNRLRGPRPIIVAFMFFSDTEDIISMARSLRGTPISISRDYPNEITNARKSLWPQFKSERANPSNRVSMVYPAKLLVNGVVVSNKFPEWDRIMRGSRISIVEGDDQTSSNSVNMNTNSAQRNLNSLTGCYTEPMDTFKHMRVPFTPSTHNSQNPHVFTPAEGRGGIGLGRGRGRGRGLTYDYECSARDSISCNGGPWGDNYGVEDRTTAQISHSTIASDLSGLPVDPDQNNEHDLCGLPGDSDQNKEHDTNSQQDMSNPPDTLIIHLVLTPCNLIHH